MTAHESETPALVTITFVEESPLKVEFKFLAGDPVDPVLIDTETEAQVRTAWKRAGEILDDLADSLEDLGETIDDRSLQPAELWKPFRDLARAGFSLGPRLTNGDPATFNAVTDASFKSWTAWQAWKPRDPLDLPRVDVYARRLSFPVEMLPLFAAPQETFDRPMENIDDLMRIGEAFVGFSALVRRLPHGGPPAPMVLPNDPALPIQYMRYLGAPMRRFGRRRELEPGFAAEQQFLTSLPHVAIDGPWPTEDMDVDAVRDGLVAALFDPERGLVRPDVGSHQAAALAHISCHCETVDRGGDEFELILSTPDGTRRHVTLGDIKGGYTMLGRPLSEEERRRTRVPIILNACGSSAIDPESAQSFHQWFLDSGHPTFVGTQGAVPDRFAAQFAEWMYRFLLGGRTLGESLLLARRKTLETGWGPLGLFYALHGNDHLDVAVKDPSLLTDVPLA